MQEVITKPTDRWTDGPALGPGPTQTSCDHLSKDTVVKAFQPQPGQDPPSVTHTPHISLGTTFSQGRKYYSFMCLKSQEDLCVLTPKKGSLGICISLGGGGGAAERNPRTTIGGHISLHSGVAQWEILPLTHDTWLLGTWVHLQTHNCFCAPAMCQVLYFPYVASLMLRANLYITGGY